MSDTLLKIAEDAFLLAANIREGENVGEAPPEEGFGALVVARESRYVELIVELGERICRTAGINDPWVPDTLRDTVEIEVPS